MKKKVIVCREVADGKLKKIREDRMEIPEEVEKVFVLFEDENILVSTSEEDGYEDYVMFGHPEEEDRICLCPSPAPTKACAWWKPVIAGLALLTIAFLFVLACKSCQNENKLNGLKAVVVTHDENGNVLVEGTLVADEVVATKVVAAEVEATRVVATEVEATRVVATEVEATRVVATEVEATKVVATEVEATKVVTTTKGTNGNGTNGNGNGNGTTTKPAPTTTEKAKGGDVVATTTTKAKTLGKVGVSSIGEGYYKVTLTGGDYQLQDCSWYVCIDGAEPNDAWVYDKGGNTFGIGFTQVEDSLRHGVYQVTVSVTAPSGQQQYSVFTVEG